MMNTSLESLNRSAESIKSLYFTPSGVFANALSFKPEITKLIRDAQDYEASMYVIDKETGDARRVDGTKSYMELVENEVQEQDEQQAHPAVAVPKIRVDPSVTSSEGLKMQSILNRLHNENYSVEELINYVSGLVEQHQSLLTNADEVLWMLNDRRAKFDQLNSEVAELEEIVELQRSKLSLMSGNMNDKHILNDENEANTVSAKELIAKEEEEIKELERLLTSKKKQDQEISESIVNDI